MRTNDEYRKKKRFQWDDNEIGRDTESDTASDFDTNDEPEPVSIMLKRSSTMKNLTSKIMGRKFGRFSQGKHES